MSSLGLQPKKLSVSLHEVHEGLLAGIVPPCSFLEHSQSTLRTVQKLQDLCTDPVFEAHSSPLFLRLQHFGSQFSHQIQEELSRRRERLFDADLEQLPLSGD